jgi:hypothetical protein
MYQIQNVVRKQQTRTHRAMSPERHRLKHYVGGQRLLVNQTITLSDEMFEEHKQEILEKVRKGIFALILPDLTKVTSTLDGKWVLQRADGATKITEDFPTGGVAPKYDPPKKMEPPKVERQKADTLEVPKVVLPPPAELVDTEKEFQQALNELDTNLNAQPEVRTERRHKRR